MGRKSTEPSYVYLHVCDLFSYENVNVNMYFEAVLLLERSLSQLVLAKHCTQTVIQVQPHNYITTYLSSKYGFSYALCYTDQLITVYSSCKYTDMEKKLGGLGGWVWMLAKYF